MKYTVVWRPSAEQDLTDLWLTAPDRNQIAEAADTIDAALQRDPLAQGESRGDGSRILIAPPLAVLFDVSKPDRIVAVWSVFRWGREP
jgi:hypothetical protein